MNAIDPFAELAAKNVSPHDRVLTALREEMRVDAKPRQSLSRARRTVLSIFALALGLALTSIKVLGYDPSAFVFALAGCSLGVSAILFAGVIPGNGRASGTFRRALLAVLCVSTFTVLALNANYFESVTHFAHEDHLGKATHCVAFSLLAGFVASTGLMIIWRRTDPFSPGLTGALLGFLGGLMGTASVSLSCRNEEGMHLTLGHGLVTLVLAGLCWIWGRRWLAP